MSHHYVRCVFDVTRSRSGDVLSNDETPPSEESGVRTLRALLAWCAIVEAASIQDGYLLLQLTPWTECVSWRYWLRHREYIHRYVERLAFLMGLAFVAHGVCEDERAVIYRRAR